MKVESIYVDKIPKCCNECIFLSNRRHSCSIKEAMGKKPLVFDQYYLDKDCPLQVAEKTCCAAEPVEAPKFVLKRYEDVLIYDVSFKKSNTKEALQAEIEGLVISELISRNAFFGEMLSPVFTSLIRVCTINPQEISHRITSLHWKGEKLYGDVEIINNPNGELILNIIHDNPSKLWFSPRTLTTPENKLCRLITFDLNLMINKF
jgi:hypothetical protein